MRPFRQIQEQQKFIENLTIENQNLKKDNAAMKQSLCNLGATEWC